MALSTTIKSIQDIMRKDVGVDGDAQRIGQLVWLLFLKIWNDREQELELLEDDFASPLVDVTDVTQFSSKFAISPQYLGSTGFDNPQDIECLRNVRT